MKFVLIEILRGTLATIIIYLLSYLIEKNSNWKLLIWSFKRKKNKLVAQGAANLDAILYFTICLFVLFFDLIRIPKLPEDFSFWNWLITMIILTIIFRQVYYKLQKIDPNRGNHDISD